MKFLEKILFTLTLSTACLFSAEPDEQNQEAPHLAAAPSLDEAPLEVFTNIANFLPAPDFYKLALTSTYLFGSEDYFKSQSIFASKFFTRMKSGEFPFRNLLEFRDELNEDEPIVTSIQSDFDPEIATFLLGLLDGAAGAEDQAWQKFESVMEKLPTKAQEFLLQKFVNRRDLSPDELRLRLEEYELRGSIPAKNHLNTLAYQCGKLFEGDLQKNFDYLEARALRGDKDANNFLNQAAACGALIFAGPNPLENLEKGIKYLKKKVAENNDENAKYWLEMANGNLQCYLNGPSSKPYNPNPLQPTLDGFSSYALYHHVFSNQRLNDAPSDESIFAFWEDLEKKGDNNVIFALLRAAYELKLGFAGKPMEAWNFISGYANMRFRCYKKDMLRAQEYTLYAALHGKLIFDSEQYPVYMQKKAAEGDEKAKQTCEKAEKQGWRQVCFENRREILENIAKLGNKKAQQMLINAAVDGLNFKEGDDLSALNPIQNQKRYAFELGFNIVTRSKYLIKEASLGHPYAQLLLKNVYPEHTQFIPGMSDTSLDWFLYFYNFVMGYEVDFNAAADNFIRKAGSH